VIPTPASIPRLAAIPVVRFQKIPMTSAGKKPAAANENAADTRNRMSAGFCCATKAANTATTKSIVLEIITRRATGAEGSIIL